MKTKLIHFGSLSGYSHFSTEKIGNCILIRFFKLNIYLNYIK